MIKSNKVSGLRKVIINLCKTLNGNVEFATSQSFIYEGKNQKCTLSEAQIKASIPIVVGAAHTIDTILKISEWSGFPIRDIYPLTRCVIESLIMAENESVAMKALRYGIFADYKYSNREVGSGKFKLKITSSNILDSSELKKLFAEFKGNKSWTDLDLPSRIGVIGEKGFEPSSQNFLGSYAFVYSISSDIIHGSPYGFKYFISAYRNRGEISQKMSSSRQQKSN